MGGGLERYEHEYWDLLGKAGLGVQRISPIGQDVSLIECGKNKVA